MTSILSLFLLALRLGIFSPKDSSVKAENRSKNHQVQPSIKTILDKKHLEKESIPNNLKIEEIDPRTKGSTIDAFQPFQNYMKDQEEKKVSMKPLALVLNLPQGILS